MTMKAAPKLGDVVRMAGEESNPWMTVTMVDTLTGKTQCTWFNDDKHLEFGTFNWVVLEKRDEDARSDRAN